MRGLCRRTYYTGTRNFRVNVVNDGAYADVATNMVVVADATYMNDVAANNAKATVTARATPARARAFVYVCESKGERERKRQRKGERKKKRRELSRLMVLRNTFSEHDDAIFGGGGHGHGQGHG